MPVNLCVDGADSPLLTFDDVADVERGASVDWQDAAMEPTLLS